MKNLIRVSLCITVLALVTIYSASIYSYMIETYSESVEFLANNTVKTSNPLRF
ncbi:hypothetical protein [uncultured Winogradskyella sp.]|uniref:hypothetical protein n=1 Tax=uncultured Winogradskyella sp. TaxID=395353 RepID=UPI00260EC84E|nr:hypothetical protein [uncultured Winogradskyella sp.]